MTRILVFNGQSLGSPALWTTDGTVAGTVPLNVGKDSTLGSKPESLTPINGRLVFAGSTNQAEHSGVWATDGTASGTTQLTGSRDPYQLIDYGPSTGLEITNPSLIAYGPRGFTKVGNSLLYEDYPKFGKSGLWTTDGTPGGTGQLLVSGASPNGIFSDLEGFQSGSLGGKLVFGAQDASGQYALWVTDGTGPGTVKVSAGFGAVPSNTSDGNQGPRDFTPFGAKLLFSAWDGEGGYGAWVTDGTSGGTIEMVRSADLDTPNPYGGTSHLVVGRIPNTTHYGFYGEQLVLSTSDGGNGFGIWKTDGTNSYTYPINAALTSHNFLTFNGEAYFGGNKFASTGGLLVSDGNFNISLIPVIGASYNFRPDTFTTFGSKFAFVGEDISGNSGLWVSNGTTSGTSEVTASGLQVSYPPARELVAFGEKLLFTAHTAVSNGLWLTDGTISGTTQLSATGAASTGLDPQKITVFEGKAYFYGLSDVALKAGQVATERTLWVTDGTSAGTVALGLKSGFRFDGSAQDSNFTIADIQTPLVAFTDTSTGTSSLAATSLYAGPVSTLDHQYIWSSPDGVAIAATSANVFLHGGSADDALTAIAGNNVLDGGLGSNFLTGATGSDGGADQFYVDGRASGTTWSTINNFHHGDNITLWGFIAGSSTGLDAAGQGAFVTDGVTGYQGATIHSELGGAGTGVNASLTIAGLSIADAATKLSVSTGMIGAEHYLFIAYIG